MIHLLITFNFLFFQNQNLQQKYEDVIDVNIIRFKPKKSEDELELLPPIQSERPEALSMSY